MPSLLERAKTLRPARGELSIDGAEVVFDKSSGISEDDQKDILVQIDKVAKQNRITVGPEVFHIKARKRGVFFPMAVNLAAVAVLAGGLFGLAWYFRQGESRIIGETGALRSAEGKLIQELKKESEAKIKEKDQEISSIQTKLGEIDKERNELQAGMDSKIKQKEAELRQDLQKEIEAERAKLNAQGLSEAAIQDRLRRLEETRSAAFNQQLTEFRREAEAEKARLEANLQKLQSDFQRNLAGLNEERQKIQRESQEREQSLRAQLDEKTRALESEKSKTQEQLSQAQTEMRRITDQREKSQNVDNQILGFYTNLRDNLGGRNYQGALQSLASLKSYLSEEAILGLPAVQKRRDIDLFVIDSFDGMIQAELKNRDEANTVAGLLKLETSLQDIRALVGRANAALSAGNAAEAEKSYNEALAKVPELLTSHQYFINKAARLESERQQALEENLRRAEASFKAGAWRETIEGYGRALGYLPPGAARETVLAQVQRAGHELSLADLRREETRAAQGLLADGQAALNQKNYDRAIGSFSLLIQRYPLSGSNQAALDGIRRAVDERRRLTDEADQAAKTELARLQKEKDELEASLRGEISALKESEARRTQELAAANRDKEALDAQYKKAMAEIDSLERKLAASQTAAADLGNENKGLALAYQQSKAEKDAAGRDLEARGRELEARDKANKNLSSEIDGLKKELEGYRTARGSVSQLAGRGDVPDDVKEKYSAMEAQNRKLVADMDRLKNAYRGYSELEDRKFAGKDVMGARAELNRFLSSETIGSYFPGFYKRITSYEKEFIKAGEKTGALQATDIYLDFNARKTREDKDRFLSAKLREFSANEGMLEFLRELRKLLR